MVDPELQMADQPETPRPDAPEAEGTPEAEATSSFMEVKLSVFEGPMDLLLHLVREHRLDIFDIPISFITEKYLQVIDVMRELDLDVAGEYLVMAATLAHIKSRMLLPKPEPEDEGEDEVSGDPRADLVRRLLEYQKYRDVAENLGGQDLLGRDVFPRDARPAPLPPEEGDLNLREVSVFKLVEALDEVLSRTKVKISHEVMLDRVSVSQRISELVDTLKAEKRVSFLSLFEGMDTKSHIIATFLAILEMARLGLARVFQETDQGDIVLSAGDRVREADEVEVQDDFR